MADNTILNTGTGGDTIATDDIAGVKYQRVKATFGADGVATDVSSTDPLPVTLANTGANGTAIKVDGSASTQPVSGTVTASIANLDVALSTRLKAADTLTAVTTVGTITNVVHVDDNSGSLTVDNANLDVALSTRLKPADTLTAVTTVGTITNVVHVDDNSSTLSVDDGAGSLTVDNGGTFAVQAALPTVSSATLANVASSASAVTLIASNASRKHAIVVNDSTAILYLKFGSSALSTSYTYLLGPGATWEMSPACIYTGIITGIWASANGNARTTEL